MQQSVSSINFSYTASLSLCLALSRLNIIIDDAIAAMVELNVISSLANILKIDDDATKTIIAGGILKLINHGI